MAPSLTSAQLKLNGANNVILNGALPRNVCASLGISKQLMQYWLAKARNPGFHPGKWGGSREKKWTAVQRHNMEILLLLYWKLSPTKTLDWYQRKLRNYRYVVSINTIRRQFKKWGINRKKLYHKMKAKYTSENLSYYLEFLIDIQMIDPKRVHFMDEAHFDYRDLWNKKIWGEVGVEHEIADASMIDKRYTVTLFTNCQEGYPALVINVTDQKNTALLFLGFVLELIKSNQLRRGDILILDNARVHTAYEMLSVLDWLFDQLGIHLVFLPTYSPEMNPCELFFALTKGWIRTHREELPFEDMLLEIIFAFAYYNKIDLVEKQYKHCREIYKKKITRLNG